MVRMTKADLQAAPAFRPAGGSGSTSSAK
jgi:hypothetical protein